MTAPVSPPSRPDHPGGASRRVLVVGLGSPDRGDDAVGPLVARGVAARLAEQRPAGGDPDRGHADPGDAAGDPADGGDAERRVEVVEHTDPTALVDLMDGRAAVVIVDAQRGGGAPGTVSVRAVPADGPALPARTDPGPAGTHGLGLAMAVELARALDRLPRRLWIVGVEAVGFEPGAGLSPPVAAAVPAAVAAVLGCLAEVTSDVS